METLLTALFFPIVVGVATDRICKWLDWKKEQPKPMMHGRRHKSLTHIIAYKHIKCKKKPQNALCCQSVSKGTCRGITSK